MTTETPASEATEGAFERERARVERTQKISQQIDLGAGRRFRRRDSLLAGTMIHAYRNAQREAGIFASISAAAFKQGFCDRALRLAVATLATERRRPCRCRFSRDG